MSDNYDPVCLHKGGDTYQSRVGTVCPFCGLIRHRHSDLSLVPVMHSGGITVLKSVVIPRRFAPRHAQQGRVRDA